MQGQLQAQEDEANEVPSEEAAAACSASYDYLLSMALWSLTIEKVSYSDTQPECRASAMVLGNHISWRPSSTHDALTPQHSFAASIAPACTPKVLARACWQTITELAKLGGLYNTGLSAVGALICCTICQGDPIFERHMAALQGLYCCRKRHCRQTCRHHMEEQQAAPAATGGGTASRHGGSAGTGGGHAGHHPHTAVLCRSGHGGGRAEGSGRPGGCRRRCPGRQAAQGCCRAWQGKGQGCCGEALWPTCLLTALGDWTQPCLRCQDFLV